MKKLSLLTLLLLSTIIGAKELPSWGMTEDQFKLPNFATKMQEIGDQALKNNWLLKITAPKDWHSKIRSGLSREGNNNVQINFKDSLYKSIAMTAVPGMKLTNGQADSTPVATAKKQVVIEKPEMDTDIEAPKFDNSTFNTGQLLDEIGELELTLPNGQNLKSNNKNTANNDSVKDRTNQQVESDAQPTKVIAKESQSSGQVSETDLTAQEQREANEQSLRMRYARSKSVDKTIDYNNITDKDDLYVEGTAVLVKRYVNQGVAVYYWMTEGYDAEKHTLESKGSGKYQKSSDVEVQQATTNRAQVITNDEVKDSKNTAFDFIAVTDQIDAQDKLRRDFIRNKAVSSTLKSSQLSKGDTLYVSGETVLIERPIGNSQSTYFWLEGETEINQEIEHTGPQKYVIK